MQRRNVLLDSYPQRTHEDSDQDERMRWGLSQRLPRWRAFDGLRSLIAPPWAIRDSAAPAPAKPPYPGRRPSHR
jgi:hypothetical protein